MQVVGLVQLLLHRFVIKVQGGKFIGLQVHTVFPPVTSHDFDVVNARYAGKLWPYGINGKVTQLFQVHLVRNQTVAGHGVGTCCEAPDFKLHSGRQSVLNAAHLCLNKLICFEHIGIPHEINVHLCRAAADSCTDTPDAFYHHYCFFDRLCHFHLHLFQWSKAKIHHDGNARECGIGENTARYPAHGVVSNGRKEQGKEDYGTLVLHGKPG